MKRQPPIVVIELAEHRPAAITPVELVADQRRPQFLNNVPEQELILLAVGSRYIAHALIRGRGRAVGVDDGAEPALLDRSTLHAQGEVIVWMQAQAAAGHVAEPGHPVGGQPQDALSLFESLMNCTRVSCSHPWIASFVARPVAPKISRCAMARSLNASVILVVIPK